jgi:CheY-like chemotaxis protein
VVIAYERKSGRDDLILPVYFVTAPVLEKADQLAADPLALEISRRQRRDWRSQADLPANDPKVWHEVKTLSEQIARALDRTKEGNMAPPSPAQDSRREQQFRDNSEIVSNRAARDPVKGQRDILTPKRILWVDDRPANNTWERASMENYNIKFVLSRSTEDALRELASDDFDAIISDMGRPPDPQAGYTLLKSVRSLGIGIPYFIYAGSRAPEHIEEAQKRGAQGTTNVATELIKMVVDAVSRG